MKRVLTLFLGMTILLTGCSSAVSNEHMKGLPAETTTISTEIASTVVSTEASTEEITLELDVDTNQFDDFSDPEFLQYIEDSVYAELAYQLNSDDYNIENVRAIYISQEYLDEVAFNSQPNLYFGYTLAELDAEFGGKRHIFTLGEDGTTIIQELTEIEDTDGETILKNVAIGTGVILVCVTVSIVAATVGVPAVSIVFASMAKTGALYALSSTVLGGTAAGIVRGYQTGDMGEALDAAALGASEGFKLGAFSGVIEGGISASLALHNAGSLHRYAELEVLKKYGGSEQQSYLNGQLVSQSTAGSTRPDVTRSLNGVLEAIEVKYCNLADENCVNNLCNRLYRQISDRIIHLPEGSTQRIVLSVQGRNYSQTVIDNAVQKILTKLDDIYPNIPIDILR